MLRKLQRVSNNFILFLSSILTLSQTSPSYSQLSKNTCRLRGGKCLSLWFPHLLGEHIGSLQLFAQQHHKFQ